MKKKELLSRDLSVSNLNSSELISYYEIFDKDLSMWQEGSKYTSSLKNTEYTVGNEFITARTGGWHNFGKWRSLTTLDCLIGSRKHPKSTLSLFHWPDCWDQPNQILRAYEMAPYRFSCLYYSVNGGKYIPLGTEEPVNIHLSYVLGSAVVKAIVEQKEFTLELYTYVPIGIPAVCQYLVLEPKEKIKKFSLILYTNPIMPDYHPAPQRIIFTHAYNDRVYYKDRGFVFEDQNYNLKLYVTSTRQPSACWCNNLNTVNEPVKYYSSEEHLKNTRVTKAEGDVEAVLRYDLKKVSSSQSFSFSYIVGHSSKEINTTAKVINSFPEKELLRKTITWWHKWLGYRKPSSKVEALIQQGLISNKTMQASTGGISCGTSWKKWFNVDHAGTSLGLLMPYGNFRAHRKDVRNLLKFERKAQEKFSPDYGCRNALCDLSFGASAADNFYYCRGGHCYYPMTCRNYLKATGDIKAIMEHEKCSKKIVDFRLWEAGSGNLLYAHGDMFATNDWINIAAKNYGYKDTYYERWVGFTDSLALSYALDLLETIAREKGRKKDVLKYAQEKKKILHAIESRLVTKEGLYGFIDPKGILRGDILCSHLVHIYYGGIPSSRWETHLEKAKERLFVTLPDENGKDIEYIFNSPLVRGRVFKWGVQGYFVMSALKAGKDKLAARAMEFLLKSASGHGSWGECSHHHTSGYHKGENGCLQFCMATGVNIAGLFAYYIGLAPLKNGFDEGFQIYPHDLDKILPVGESFGAGISFQITRLDKETYSLRIPLLKNYSTKKYILKSSQPMVKGLKKIILTREEIIKGISSMNLNNKKINFLGI